jgi:GDP-mannose 6-dehydrogenase
MDIAVFGLGYVGCVTAACLAHLGHRVTGVERDEHKIRCVRSGVTPFFEPGLDGLVAEGVAAGRLSATSSVPEAMRAADVALVCVGTPSERNGNLSVEQLRRVSAEIAAVAPSLHKPLVVAVRSTVYPGTCEDVVSPVLGPKAAVVSNPEFLREGMAVKDFMEPSLLVVGGTDRAAVALVAGIYTALNVEPCLVSLRTAEMIKYACNAFHAVKVGFANEIGTLCDRLGLSGREVMDTLCRDVKLNASAAYLRPGFAFGGSCLPKDLRALVYRASRLDLKLPLLESVLPANDQHLARAIQSVMDLPARRLGIYGLSFKENTDDLRESPVVALIEYLIGKGRELRVFDPHIRLDSIYGSNLNFLMSSIPHIGRLLCGNLEELLGWGDSLVLTQKPSGEAAARIQAAGLPLLELYGSPPLSRSLEARLA